MSSLLGMNGTIAQQISSTTNTGGCYSTNTGGLYYNGGQIYLNGSQINWVDYNPVTKTLKNLPFKFLFDIEDKNNILFNNIRGVKKNKLIFNCDYVGNRVQPYEFIMELINDNKKFTVEIEVSDILTIKYINFKFTKIENNLKINNSNCDFSELKVNFKYDKILYENHKLSIKELRVEKLNKINKINKI